MEKREDRLVKEREDSLVEERKKRARGLGGGDEVPERQNKQTSGGLVTIRIHKTLAALT